MTDIKAGSVDAISLPVPKRKINGKGYTVMLHFKEDTAESLQNKITWMLNIDVKEDLKDLHEVIRGNYPNNYSKRAYQLISGET